MFIHLAFFRATLNTPDTVGGVNCPNLEINYGKLIIVNPRVVIIYLTTYGWEILVAKLS